MILKKIVFDQEKNVYMNAYLYEKSDELPELKKRPAVVVCPGGGYRICSAREADPIALKYVAQGFNTFVLYYSLNDYSVFPNSVCDLSRALKHIRDNAEEYGVLSDKIAVCGFSAGGHVAATLGTLWNDPEIQKAAGVSGEENRPNAMILGYAVTSTKWIYTNDDDFPIIRSIPPEKRAERLDCAGNIGDHTPPAFLFHTQEDNTVPVTDSLDFARAMIDKGRPCELHIFPNGWHGLSLATKLTGAEFDDVAQWMPLSVNWLKRTFDF